MEIILETLHSTAANKVIAIQPEYRILKGVDALSERGIRNPGHLLLFENRERRGVAALLSRRR